MDVKKKKTKVIEESTNPQFYEAVELTYLVRNAADLSSYPPLIFDVYDEDKVLGRSKKEYDDFLGRATIFAGDIDASSILMLE
jgi:hypothetical protein